MATTAASVAPTYNVTLSASGSSAVEARSRHYPAPHVGAVTLLRPPPTAIALRGPYGGSPPLNPTGNVVLRRLVLSNQDRITPAAGPILAQIIGVPEYERAPVPAAATLDYLVLSWCDLRSEGCLPILRAVNFAPQRLVHLDLSFTGMDDQCADALALVVKENASLRQLDVSHNKLGPRSAAAVAAQLASNITLVTLLMGFNALGFEGTMALALATKSNVKLEEIGLENTCTDGAEGDRQVQKLWNRIRRVNLGRSLPLRAAVEYPPRKRAWDGEPDPVLDAGDGEASKDSLEWSIERSTFGSRKSECDSRDYYDAPGMLRQAFMADWEQTKLPRIVPNEQSRRRIRELMQQAYPLLRESFRAYALSNPGGDPFDISYGEMMTFWKELGLVDLIKAEGNRDAQALFDLAFVSTNYEAKPTEFNSSDAILRFEYLEMIVRIALAIYAPPTGPGRKDDELKIQAVERLLRDNLLPKLRVLLGVDHCFEALEAAQNGWVRAIGSPLADQDHDGVPDVLEGMWKFGMVGQGPGPASGHGASAGGRNASSSLLGRRPPSLARLPGAQGAAGGAAGGPASWGRVPDASVTLDSVTGRSVLRPEDVATPALYSVGGVWKDARRALAEAMGHAGEALPGTMTDAALDRARKRRNSGSSDLSGLPTAAGGASGGGGGGGGASDDASSLVSGTTVSGSVSSPPAEREPLTVGEADVVSNAFRRLWLYREDVDRVLSSFQAPLAALFRRFSGKDALPGERRKFMSLTEWMTVCARAGVVPRYASEHHVKAAYVWSAMSVIDENRSDGGAAKNFDAPDRHTEVEFYETICRLAAAAEGLGAYGTESVEAVAAIRSEMRRAQRRRLQRGKLQEAEEVKVHVGRRRSEAAIHLPGDLGEDRVASSEFTDEVNAPDIVDDHTDVSASRGGEPEGALALSELGATAVEESYTAGDGPTTAGGASALQPVTTAAGHQRGIRRLPQHAYRNGDLLSAPSLAPGGFKLGSEEPTDAELDRREDSPQRRVVIHYLCKIDFLVRLLKSILYSTSSSSSSTSSSTTTGATGAGGGVGGGAGGLVGLAGTSGPR